MTNKRTKLAMVIILILLGLLFIVWYKQPKTVNCTRKEYMGKEESIFRYSGLIKQIDINQRKVYSFILMVAEMLIVQLQKKGLVVIRLLMLMQNWHHIRKT